MVKISIIIPVYNEKDNILPTTERIIDSFISLKNEIEILFIDDASPDGTEDEVLRVSKIHNQVKLVQHGIKEGIGAAHQAGYREARGDYILCIDADLSQSPIDLLKIKNKLDQGYDLVIGSRYIDKGKQIGKSPIRDIGSRGMNLICRYFLGINLTDCTHTFRGFRKVLFEEFDHKLDTKGHPAFQVQFSFWIFHMKKKILEIPIYFKEREGDRGSSKISIKKEAPSFLRLVFRLVKYRFINNYS